MKQKETKVKGEMDKSTDEVGNFTLLSQLSIKQASENQQDYRTAEQHYQPA